MNNYRPYPSITPAVKIIIIINVIMYFMTEIIDKKTGSNLSNTLGLHLPQSEYWAPYQYITHMFMHGSISHLFFNMFALFMFGRVLESIWGTQRFLVYYFVTGLGAAALNSAVGWWEYDKMYEQFQAFQNTPDRNTLSFKRAFVDAGYFHPPTFCFAIFGVHSGRRRPFPQSNYGNRQHPDHRGLRCHIRNITGFRHAFPEYRAFPDVHSDSDQGQILCDRLRSIGIFPRHTKQCRRQRSPLCPFGRYAIRLYPD